MGTLAPLYLAGLAALALPLILHLIRRTPRGRQEFSSLMFLSPSPPRLTRRSRLDQILLLLVRLAVLAVLAFAFARPFFRETALLSLGELPPRKVAILVDTSASMRRGDLWPQAMAEVERKLAELAPQDEVALFTFSDRLAAVVPFVDRDENPVLAATEAIRRALAPLRPSWAASDLGLALTTLATELDAARDVDQSHDEPTIVVISDFQKGSRSDALQSFEWPAGVQVVARAVAVKQPTNAYAELLENDDDPAQEPRVRVVNAANSVGDQFYIRWANRESAGKPGEDTAVYVPPGQSRVVRLPLPEDDRAVDRIVLRGDDQDFDNLYYVVTPPKQEVNLLYLGADGADDTRGLQYYLRLAMASDARRQLKLTAPEGDGLPPLGGPLPPQLVVVTRALGPDLERALTDYVQAGGTLLVVAKDRDAAAMLPRLFDDVELADPPSDRERSGYALLGEIDFSQPMFAAFTNPKYSDFTKIHFWQHRLVRLKPQATTRAVARFDNGDPWLLERTAGRGRLLALTSGWQPDDSQLAVASKFVPLVGGLLDAACGTTASVAGATVNERVALPKPTVEAAVVHLPDGREVTLAANSRAFSETEQPGIYRLGRESEAIAFAVNLSASESDTAPLDLEQVKQLGVPMGVEVSAVERLSRTRQERDTELESRQKLWQWLLAVCLGLVILETWMAGRASRPAHQRMRAAV